MKKDNVYIGIDLGTSAVKLLAVAPGGDIVAEADETYSVSYPRSGWSEQNPEDWYSAALRGMEELLKGQDRDAVKGISFGGRQFVQKVVVVVIVHFEQSHVAAPVDRRVRVPYPQGVVPAVAFGGPYPA